MDFASRVPQLVAAATSWPAGLAIPILVSAYLGLVQIFRFQRLREMQTKFRYPTRESYAKMTDDDAWRIQREMGMLEFPFIFYKSIQFALFKTYGIPTISGLLLKTTEFTDIQTSLKRYSDTSVLIQEFVAHPPSSPRSHEGIARMNFLHHNYIKAGKILDDDMLYTLSLFALEPVRWINRYEWRKVTEFERCALGTFWKSIGDAMEISYDVLPSSKTGFKDGLHWFEEIEAWSMAYEAKAMVPHKDNYMTANATIDILLWEVPSPMKPLGRKSVHLLMEDRLRTAMMYDHPGWAHNLILSGILEARRLFLRYLSFPRPFCLRMTTVDALHDEPAPHPVLGWEGAPYYVKPTLWNRWGPRAWYSRALGLPNPGDDGDKYYPGGFKTRRVGPKRFDGKGQDYFEGTKERLGRERRGQCPFSLVK